MAITFSHPAAAIPLRRMGLLLSPLIVGSIAPDFEFFLRFTDQRSIGHTLPGIIIFCVPLGLIALWIFHSLLKLPLVSLLPREYQMRLLPMCGTFRFFPLRRLAMIVLSLLAGTVTHIAWDAFTHPDGWIVLHIPALSAPLVGLPQGMIVRVNVLIQYLSSLLGVVLMTVWFFRWRKRTPLAQGAPFYRIPAAKRAAIAFSTIIVAIVGGTARGFIAVPEVPGLSMAKSMFIDGVIGSGSCFMGATILFGVVWRLGGVTGLRPTRAHENPDDPAQPLSPIRANLMAETVSSRLEDATLVETIKIASDLPCARDVSSRFLSSKESS